MLLKKFMQLRSLVHDPSVKAVKGYFAVIAHQRQHLPAAFQYTA
jgi:hypothetical protein